MPIKNCYFLRVFLTFFNKVIQSWTRHLDGQFHCLTQCFFKWAMQSTRLQSESPCGAKIWLLSGDLLTVFHLYWLSLTLLGFRCLDRLYYFLWVTSLIKLLLGFFFFFCLSVFGQYYMVGILWDVFVYLISLLMNPHYHSSQSGSGLYCFMCSVWYKYWFELYYFQ